MKIIISGGWGYGNLGDEAILFCTVELLKTKTKIENSEITVMSYNPKYSEQIVKTKCISSLHNLLFKNKKESKERINELNRWLEFGDPLKNQNLISLVKEFEKSEIFIMAGGGYYNDLWKDNFIAHNFEIKIAHKFGLKIYLLNQTIGPINDETNRKEFSEISKKVNVINVRDKQTSNLINKISDLNVEVSGDVVNTISLFKSNKNKKGKIKIGVMIQHYRPYTSSEDNNFVLKMKKYKNKIIMDEKRYIRKIIKILTNVENQIDCEFKFISSTNWDSDICEKICNKLKKSKRNIKCSFEFTYDVQHFINNVITCDLMFSTNMHPIIIASSYGIPSVAISYFYKIDDYMEAIGLKQYTHNIECIDEKKICKQIIELLNDKEQNVEIKNKVSLINDEIIKLYENI